jgi:BirA family transcriptional regulator, biotin operon repressor / biotin---[acetyl-CoA-carboxylase] ligase
MSLRLGRPRLHHRVCDSTNERARTLAVAGAPHGSLVTADEQAAGRGRQGRRWTAPAGTAVLMSLVVRDLDERHALLPLAVAVAVCEACEALAPVSCTLKWPNDVLIDQRKLAGILIEGRPREGWAVIGVGLNVTSAAAELPPELRHVATSLRITAGNAAPTVAEALRTLVDALERRLRDEPRAILSAWRERDALRGRPVRWPSGEGVAAGVDDSGALLVDSANGRVALDAGEVHLVPGDGLAS